MFQSQFPSSSNSPSMMMNSPKHFSSARDPIGNKNPFSSANGNRKTNPMDYIESFFVACGRVLGSSSSQTLHSIKSLLKAIVAGISALFVAGKLFMDEDEIQELFQALKAGRFISADAIAPTLPNNSSNLSFPGQGSIPIGPQVRVAYSASDVKDPIDLDGFESIDKYEDLENEFDQLQDEIEEELHWKLIHKQAPPKRTIASFFSYLVNLGIFPVKTAFQFTSFVLRIAVLTFRFSPLIASFCMMQLCLYAHRYMYTTTEESLVTMSSGEVVIDSGTGQMAPITVRQASLQPQSSTDTSIGQLSTSSQSDCDRSSQYIPVDEIRLGTSSGPSTLSGGRLSVVNGKLTTTSHMQRQKNTTSSNPLDDGVGSSKSIKETTFADEGYVLPDSPVLDKLKLFAKVQLNRLFVTDKSVSAYERRSGAQKEMMTSDSHGRVITQDSFVDEISKDGTGFSFTNTFLSGNTAKPEPKPEPESTEIKLDRTETTLTISPLDTSSDIVIDVTPVASGSVNGKPALGVTPSKSSDNLAQTGLLMQQQGLVDDGEKHKKVVPPTKAVLRKESYCPPQWAHTLEDLWWSWLTSALESAGPTFIKLGQYASSRQDVFSADICSRLGKLRDSNEVHSWEETELALQNHIGLDWEDYVYISEYDRQNPIGSGCIAQVYRGFVYPKTSTVEGQVLQPTNSSSHLLENQLSERSEEITTVAIKVLHPNVSWQISRDLKLIAFLANIAESIPYLGLRWVSPSEMCVEFSRLMKTQLNLNREAKNLIKFANNFKSDYLFGKSFCVDFPKVVLSRSGLLIETFETGIPISLLLRENRQVLDLDMSRNMLHDKTPVSQSDWKTLPGFIQFVYSQAEAILRLNNRVINNEHMDEVAHNELVKDKLEELVRATERYTSVPFDECSYHFTPKPITEARDEHSLPPNTDLTQLAILRSLSPRQRMYIQREIAKCGLYAFMRMLFEHGFFHADLHPGNIIVDLGYTSPDLTYGAVKKAKRKEVNLLTPQPSPLTEMERQKELARMEHPDGQMPSEFADWGFSHFVTAAKSIFSLDNDKFVRLYKEISDRSSQTEFNEDEYDVGVLPGDYSSVFPSKVFEFIHADDMNTHPSYFVNENTYKAKFMENMLPVPDIQPKVIMIDAGMSTVLTKYDMRNFRDLFFFVASGRGEEAAALMIERAKSTDSGKKPQRTPEEHRLFVKEVSAVIDQAFFHGFNLNSMSIVNTLTSLLNAARTYKVKLDTSFISVIIAVTVMEGVGRSLDPDVNVIAPALEIVARSKLTELKDQFVEKMK